SWTLTYGNAGAAPLLNTLVQDTLPPGFVYVSSSSSPALGNPLVIPGSPAIVRWNAGAVAANSPAAGTLTISALAGPVTSGTGNPLTQVFTNIASAGGEDASGAHYAAAASASISVQQLPMALGKTADKSVLNLLPGTISYTIRP